MTSKRADNKCEDCGEFVWTDGLDFEDKLLCSGCAEAARYEDEGELVVEFTP